MQSRRLAAVYSGVVAKNLSHKYWKLSETNFLSCTNPREGTTGRENLEIHGPWSLALSLIEVWNDEPYLTKVLRSQSNGLPKYDSGNSRRPARNAVRALVVCLKLLDRVKSHPLFRPVRDGVLAPCPLPASW